MSFKDKDHFSGHAACYQQFRPNYPAPLFAYLASLCPAHRPRLGLCNRQRPGGRARWLRISPSHRRHGLQCSADRAGSDRTRRSAISSRLPIKAPIDDGTVDLVTVAQALHWFDLSSFYPRGAPRREARRNPRGLVLPDAPHHAGDRRDRAPALFRHRRGRTGHPSARSSRKVIERCRSRSTSLRRPSSGWCIPGTSNTYLGYFGSWSSTQRYRKQNGTGSGRAHRRRPQSGLGRSRAQHVR